MVTIGTAIKKTVVRQVLRMVSFTEVQTGYIGNTLNREHG